CRLIYIVLRYKWRHASTGPCMFSHATHTSHPHHLRDHSADLRMIGLAAAAVVIGTGGAFGAWLLTRLIALATNLFWLRAMSFTPAEIGTRQLAWELLVIPVTGALVIGLMA